MENIRVMFVEDNGELRRLLGDYFSQQKNIEIVGLASNGQEAIDLITKVNVDVLVLDMIMPQMDGYALLDRLNSLELKTRPRVIALTALGRDDFITRAVELGVRYYMVKPFDFAVLERRINEVAADEVTIETRAMPPPPQRSPDERVANLFLTIGIPAHIKGYHYLREGVKMVINNPDVINRITKELYPGIARRYGTTSSKVERAIRHAIEVAWSRGRLDTINQIFGYKIFTDEDKPTNGEFIALVADKLMLEQIA